VDHHLLHLPLTSACSNCDPPPAHACQAGLTLDDIDVYEINEAFASQATYCVQKLGLDESKVGVGSWCRHGGGAAQQHNSTTRVDAFTCTLAQVNPNGGAIALGHPLGATGARMTASLLHEMARRGSGARFGVVSMCIGSGMGAAAVFERGGEVDALRNGQALPGRHVNLSKDAVV
jgi:acetyl-CoA acyltransferase 1